MQDQDWARACANAFDGSHEPHLIVAGSRQHPEAIAPLAMRRRPIRRLELLGASQISEPTDFLYANDDALAELADALLALRRPLLLERLPATSQTARAIRDRARRYVVICRKAPGCPFIELDARWEEPEQLFNAGRRSDLRRALRRAEKLGPVSYQVLSPSADDLDSLLDRAYRVEAAGWKGRGRTALAADATVRAFFGRYARDAAEQGILRLGMMRIGDQAAAMQIAVELRERFWLLKIGYDERFARCSPGNLLMLHTVRHAANRGLRSYEFLGMEAPWTRAWTESVRPCVTLRAYPLRPRGVFAFVADAASSALRRLTSGLGWGR